MNKCIHSVEHVTDVLSCRVCLYSALVCLYSVLVDTPKSFPEWLYWFIIPLAVYESSSRATSLSTLAFPSCVLTVLMIVISYMVISCYGFSLHVPGVNEIEHLFVSDDRSFMKCRFKHLLIFLGCLISFIYRTSLCILDMNHYQIYILQHLMVCDFSLFKNFLPMPSDMQDLSSLPRDRICAPCSESPES